MAFADKSTKKTALKGRYLMLFIDEQFIPLSTSCDLEETVSMIDPETKDDSIYQTLDEDSKQWNINSECQLDEDCDTLKVLHEYYRTNTKVPLLFVPNSEKSDDSIDGSNGKWSALDSAFGLKGDAYLTSLKVSAPLTGKCTVSCSFTGTGKLDVHASSSATAE